MLGHTPAIAQAPTALVRHMTPASPQAGWMHITILCGCGREFHDDINIMACQQEAGGVVTCPHCGYAAFVRARHTLEITPLGGVSC